MKNIDINQLENYIDNEDLIPNEKKLALKSALSDLRHLQTMERWLGFINILVSILLNGKKLF